MLGLLAHAAHFLLVALGLVGVALLLLPQVQAARSRRTAFRAPGSREEHQRRVAALREAADSGQLTAAPDPDTVLSTRWPARDASLWRALAVSSSGAAAGVHAAILPHHAAEWWVVGAFFLAVTLAQAAWACLVSLDATRERLVAGIVGSLGLVALWAVSRTLGLPFGLGREAVGAWDLAAVAWELVLVAACVVGLRRPRDERALVLGDLGRLAWSWVLLSGTVLLVLTLTVSHG